jgi:type II secretion system protein I
MTRSRTESGFTLLEVLIAAVLIGSVFVAVTSLMSQSLRNIDRMRPHEIAMMHAQEKMNEQLVRDELVPESTAGQWDDGYRWTVEITPLDFEAVGQSTAAPQPVVPSAKTGNSTVTAGSNTLFQVRVLVAWGDRADAKTYKLDTMQWAMWPTPKS